MNIYSEPGSSLRTRVMTGIKNKNPALMRLTFCEEEAEKPNNARY